jgi:hypothetical protein
MSLIGTNVVPPGTLPPTGAASAGSTAGEASSVAKRNRDRQPPDRDSRAPPGGGMVDVLGQLVSCLNEGGLISYT